MLRLSLSLNLHRYQLFLVEKSKLINYLLCMEAFFACISRCNYVVTLQQMRSLQRSMEILLWKISEIFLYFSFFRLACLSYLVFLVFPVFLVFLVFLVYFLFLFLVYHILVVYLAYFLKGTLNIAKLGQFRLNQVR